MVEKKQTHVIMSKIYFYHTRETLESYSKWKENQFPGHILYGLPMLEKYGIQSVMHKYKHYSNRFRLMLYVTKEILLCKEMYDALYGTSFRGIELIIFLRALGLYRKPIIIWHHTAVTTATNPIRELIAKFFYKGIDKMFFFSQKLLNDSLKSPKAPTSKLKLIHWGPDLPFYDNILKEFNDLNIKKNGFISTGKENRDIATLIKAFSKSNQKLDIYIAESCGNLNYKNIIKEIPLPPSVQIYYKDGVIPYELAKIVSQKSYIVIPCLEFPYTVGLTTLVEALALGMPIICSRNPNFEIDIDKENIGITVEYGDVQGWEKAIQYIAEHPEEAKQMGENARRLAEEKFNLEIFSREIAEVLIETIEKRK